MFSLMHLASQLIPLLTGQNLVNLVIVFVAIYLAKFYSQLWHYPPGPFPLPIIGNLLKFIRFKEHWNLEVIELSKKYGPVMTLWIGPTPFIWVCDLQLGKQAFSKYEFTGRPWSYFGHAFNNHKHKDIFFSDGKPWKNLRKVSLIAIRKFAKTDIVVKLIDKVVEHNVQLIRSKEGTDRPFSPHSYVFNIFYNVLGSAVFSQDFDIDNKEMEKFKYISTDFEHDLGAWLFAYEFIPIVRLFMKNPLKAKYYTYVSDIHKSILKTYKSNERIFDCNKRSHFMDVLIDCKHRAIQEEKECAKYFDDSSMTCALIELWIAGTETSHTTFKWMLIYLALYSDIQTKLRHEINGELEGRMPAQEDIKTMHYTMAFISEALRLRNSIPFGVFHCGLNDSTIGAYNVLRGTRVVFHHQCVMLDERHWMNADVFKPQRFLGPNGEYLEIKSDSYCPFSVGRRKCPGEVLAMVNLFMILVRFIQLTGDCDIELENKYANPDILWPDPVFPWLQFPKQYNIILKTRIGPKFA